jgi:hypothetical protein
VKPQRTRCGEWVAPLGRLRRCDRPLTHRVVGRWKNFPGWPERELMCGHHAEQFVRGNSPFSSVTISAYRVRKANP